MKRIFLAILVLLVSAAVMRADSGVTTEPIGTDSVVWSQLGSPYTAIPNPFDFTTTDGVAGTGNYASGTGDVMQQTNTWSGNFAPNDYLNWTDLSAGAITLNFDQGYTQIGAQIETDDFGAFTAQICDNNDSQCFTENGVSADTNDGSAIYIGIESGTPITSATFSITADDNLNDFAIDTVELNGGSPTVTPEPSSLLLLGTGIVGLVVLMRRKFSSAL